MTRDVVDCHVKGQARNKITTDSKNFTPKSHSMTNFRRTFHKDDKAYTVYSFVDRSCSIE